MTSYTLSRSIINQSIENALKVFSHFGVSLPSFAAWGSEAWATAGKECDEIRHCALGWDVTDFGSNRYHEIGRTLFTLRNGRSGDARYPKSYAEKLILDPEGQRAPAHYHRSKREDIINRAGGNIIVELTATEHNGNPASTKFQVAVDGVLRTLGPREQVRLLPGQSLCIPPQTIHQFWGEVGTGFKIDGVGYTVSGEVSSVCDDWSDNVFMDSWAKRFPDINEDAPRIRYLCHEYPSNEIIDGHALMETSKT